MKRRLLIKWSEWHITRLEAKINQDPRFNLFYTRAQWEIDQKLRGMSLEAHRLLLMLLKF